MAQSANENAISHGGSSARRIGRGAAIQKRRILRQNGLRKSDLDALGQALLTNWARAAAALQAMDDYASTHGWLSASGEPQPFTRLYVSVLNSERLAIGRLEGHLRARSTDPQAALSAWIEALPQPDEGADEDAS